MKSKIIFLLLFGSCGFLPAQENDSVKIDILNLGDQVNSTFRDYAPVISADGRTMFFTSRRPVTKKDIEKNREGGEHIYCSEYNSEKENWSKAKLVAEPINEERRNTSAIAVSNDGQRMLLYRDNPFVSTGNIYQSFLKGEMWSDPEKFPAPINSQYHESSASISPDGRTIYFVSNRPDGIGGRDIWYCTQDKDGNWGEAVNIGPPINTESDEEGVFIHPDGKTLYFSSKGHSGKGGYDIFRSRFNNGEWSEPENLGAPLNTAGDDVFFVMEANGTIGYYSSSKAGGEGDKDIYQVTFTPLEKDKQVKPSLVLLKGVVSDEKNDIPLEASIEIIDNENNEELSSLSSNSSSGKYLVSLPAGKNYRFNVKAEGYLFYSENFNISDTASYEEVEKNIRLKKLTRGNDGIKIDDDQAKGDIIILQDAMDGADQANTRYTVQIVASSTMENASKKQGQLKNNGFDAYVQQVNFTDVNEQWYRVRIGTFSSIDLAIEEGKKLLEQDLLQGKVWIDVKREDNLNIMKKGYQSR